MGWQMASEWKIRIDENEYPAESVQQLRTWVQERRLLSSHYVYNPILACWMYAKDLEELKESFTSQPGNSPRRANLAECGYCKKLIDANLTICPYCNVQVFKSHRPSQQQREAFQVKPVKKSQSHLWMIFGGLVIVGMIISSITSKGPSTSGVTTPAMSSVQESTPTQTQDVTSAPLTKVVLSKGTVTVGMTSDAVLLIVPKWAVVNKVVKPDPVNPSSLVVRDDCSLEGKTFTLIFAREPDPGPYRVISILSR